MIWLLNRPINGSLPQPLRSFLHLLRSKGHLMRSLSFSLIVASLLPCFVLLGIPTRCLGKSPNVVFFLVDDLGYMDVGVNNPETFYETPNIDRLAAKGTNFTNGYAANPVCSPTRFSILTGKYPSRGNATNFFAGKRAGRFLPAVLHDRMPLDELTLAEAFKQHGYRTMFAGKWHLGPTADYWPTKQGFDLNFG